MQSENNSIIILIVVSTVCFLAAVGVCTLAACAFWKIPDMSGSMSAALTQTTSTLVGALIACLINTRAQKPRDEAAPPIILGDGVTGAADGKPPIINQPIIQQPVTAVTTQPVETKTTP